MSQDSSLQYWLTNKPKEEQNNSSHPTTKNPEKEYYYYFLILEHNICGGGWLNLDFGEGNKCLILPTLLAIFL